MTISSAKAQLSKNIGDFDQYISEKNATSYETSMLFQEVDTFNKNIHTNIIDNLDEFANKLRAIKIDESNYKNTASKIGSLKSSVAEGRIAIDGYNTSISKKSIEVFNEYIKDFDSLKMGYDQHLKSAKKNITNAETAQDKYNNVPEWVTKTEGSVMQNPDYFTDRTRWARERDKQLGLAEIQLNDMQKCISNMKELLEKGLKKTA